LVKSNVFAIGGRSTSVLIRNQGVGDLYRLHSQTKRDGIGFNLMMIPDDFAHPSEGPFDTAYMSALYERGFEVGQKVQWLKAPPGIGGN
jgi:hypothetical protein